MGVYNTIRRRGGVKQLANRHQTNRIIQRIPPTTESKSHHLRKHNVTPHPLFIVSHFMANLVMNSVASSHAPTPYIRLRYSSLTLSKMAGTKSVGSGSFSARTTPLRTISVSSSPSSYTTCNKYIGDAWKKRHKVSNFLLQQPNQTFTRTNTWKADTKEVTHTNNELDWLITVY